MKESAITNNSRIPEQKYETLVREFAPYHQYGAIFSFSRPITDDFSRKCWKFHISASILNITETLELVGPLLHEKNIMFKVPIDLSAVERINRGFDHEFCQVGKVMTVYPDTLDESFLLDLIWQLHCLTKHDLRAPMVPYDKRFRADSRVYYRYGSYYSGDVEVAMREVDKERLPGNAVPEGVLDPFCSIDKEPIDVMKENDLALYPVFEAIRQRGKGGVYRAIDLSDGCFNTCIIKEGRRYGEVDVLGNDGFDYRRSERERLQKLADLGVPVPAIIDTIVTENGFYLILEDVSGSLSGLISKKVLSDVQKVEILVSLASSLEIMHEDGVYWLDCKPSNISVMNDGRICLFDFEGQFPAEDGEIFCYRTFDIQDHKNISLADIDRYGYLLTAYQLLNDKLLSRTRLNQDDLLDCHCGFEFFYDSWSTLISGALPEMSISDYKQSLILYKNHLVI